MTDKNFIAVIPKSETECTHIQINEHKGKKYLDLRVFFTTDAGKLKKV